jgi:hypothetical protein
MPPLFCQASPTYCSLRSKAPVAASVVVAAYTGASAAMDSVIFMQLMTPPMKNDTKRPETVFFVVIILPVITNQLPAPRTVAQK